LKLYYNDMWVFSIEDPEKKAEKQTPDRESQIEEILIQKIESFTKFTTALGEAITSLSDSVKSLEKRLNSLEDKIDDES
jgi:phage shock protein A